MNFADIKKLTVKYNGSVVGYLAMLEDEKIAFQYDDEWVENGFSLSPFSLPLSDKIYINPKDNFGGLYGVFNDSLPDGWGELLIKRKLAEKGINYDRLSPLSKLALVNGNGLGGLNYEPTIAEENKQAIFDLDSVADGMIKIFDNEELGNRDLDVVYQLGGSSGGARPKAHVLIDGEEWIIKFPCRIDPENAGEEEYVANSLAKQCGINVNEFKLFPSKTCSGYFGAKRFDRVNGKRRHMVSLSSLLETSHRIPNLDYMHLFQVIQRICVNKEDLYEAFRRMTFNVFYKNRDDHGKNFAFLYDEDAGGYVLSPAYDITRTPNKSEHEMTVNGNCIPTESDLLAVAERFKLSRAKCEKIINRSKYIIQNGDWNYECQQ